MPTTHPENSRRPLASVDPQFIQRWSPRAFREEPVGEDRLEILFEAARWAPSSYNGQPWFFVWGQGEEEHAKIFELLSEGNKTWAKRAPVLMILFARRHFDNGKPNRHFQFDAGSAWLSLALQAERLGLKAHAMAGFDEERTYAALGVDPEKYEAMCAIAVGHQDAPEILPDDLREKEKPNTRKPPEQVALRVRDLARKTG